MGVFLIVLGLAMIVVGISAWRGWYRSWARGPLGNMYVPLAPTGVGVLVLGLSGLFEVRWLALPSVLVMLGGVLLYVISPSFIQPAWYREYKRSPNKRAQ